MLSYLVPVEEKPPPVPGKGRLALELVGSPGSPESVARRARTNISKESSTSSFASDLTISSSTPTGALDKPKHKLLGNGTKHTTLKSATTVGGAIPGFPSPVDPPLFGLLRGISYCGFQWVIILGALFSSILSTYLLSVKT